MGAETSQIEIVDFEALTNNRTAEPWLNYSKDPYYDLLINKPNRGTIDIEMALNEMQRIFMSFTHPINILEVGSGNGFNTRLVSKLKNIKSFIASDMLDYKEKYYEPINTELSHIAVQNHKDDIDILLLISPPPGNKEGYMDYYAIKEFELKTQKNKKHLMILGELGASDGTTGIYQYLMNDQQSNWNLISEYPFFYKKDSFGFDCIKSVYFFVYNQNDK